MMPARSLLVAVCLFAATSTHAEPISDPAVWTQQFVEQALKGDVDEMGALLSNGAAPGLNAGAFVPGVRALLEGAGSPTAQFAEAFGEANVGSFIKRVNVAVSYPTSFLFYSFSLGRHEQGWYVYGFKVGGDLNEILNAPWPH